MNKENKTIVTANSRDPLSRAKLFLMMAKNCLSDNRVEFEALIEACIVFARSKVNRLITEYNKDPRWKNIFESWKTNTTIIFFREERNRILKEAPPKINQRIFAPFFDASKSETIINTNSPTKAAGFYYFSDPNILATDELERHLLILEELVDQALQTLK